MRIQLRALSQTDLDRVHVLVSNPEVVRHMLIPLCRTLEESRAFLQAILRGFGEWPAWGILYEGRLEGLCGIGLQRQLEAGEIWYLLDPAVWGRGLASEAVAELLRTGFEEFGLHRIWATCCPENAASIRVLEKAGLRREGYLVRNERIQGEWRDTWLYAILEEEWRARFRPQPPHVPLESQ